VPDAGQKRETGRERQARHPSRSDGADIPNRGRQAPHAQPTKAPSEVRQPQGRGEKCRVAQSDVWTVRGAMLPRRPKNPDPRRQMRQHRIHRRCPPPQPTTAVRSGNCQFVPETTRAEAGPAMPRARCRPQAPAADTAHARSRAPACGLIAPSATRQTQRNSADLLAATLPFTFLGLASCGWLFFIAVRRRHREGPPETRSQLHNRQFPT